MSADKINSEHCWLPAVAKAMAGRQETLPERSEIFQKDKKSFLQEDPAVARAMA
jgi:hypothetical protein